MNEDYEEEIKEEKQYEEVKAKKTKKVKEPKVLTKQESTNRLLIIGVFFILIFLWALSNRNNINLSLTDPLFNDDKTKEEENTETETEFDAYLTTVSKVMTTSHEYIYTVETDNNDQYFYLRADVEKEKTLFYKEFKDKSYIYYKNNLTYYIPGVSTWKKVTKGITYEGYDTILFTPVNLYNLLKESDSNSEVTDTDSIKKVLVKVDLNKLLKLYNSTVEETEVVTLPEDKTSYLDFYIYEENEHLIINVDLTSYYKKAYNKEYPYIVYGLDFSKIGEITLDNIDSFDFGG